tara:strand:- start:337 stop:1323 length:987 start_codon:yes stop_codon:yes gene_type:complete
MIVFTCVNKESEDAAIIWAASLKDSLSRGKGGVKTYMFHTPDVDTTRFVDFNVVCVTIDGWEDPTSPSTEEILVKVLDLMIARDFTDRVLYTSTDVLWQGPVDELLDAPHTKDIWLAARNDNVFYDDKRNAKFYPHYDSRYKQKNKINPDGYFNGDVLFILLAGLQQAVIRKRFRTLEEYCTTRRSMYGNSVEDCFNQLAGEYINLFDRFNAFAEDVLDLDFGELLAIRKKLNEAILINFRGVHKPWRETVSDDLPELAGSQYPFDVYLSCCETYVTYITKSYMDKVRANAKRYSMLSEWHSDILSKSSTLKDKLVKFKDDIKAQTNA